MLKQIPLVTVSFFTLHNFCQENQIGNRREHGRRSQERPIHRMLSAEEEASVINSLLAASRRHHNGAPTSFFTSQHSVTFRQLPAYDNSRQTGLSLVSPEAAIQSSRAIGRLAQPDSQAARTGNPVGSIGYTDEDDHPRPRMTAPIAEPFLPSSLNERRNHSVSPLLDTARTPASSNTFNLLGHERSQQIESGDDEGLGSFTSIFSRETDLPER